MGISPYEGDTFHESPLFLHFYNLIYDNFINSNWIPYLFIVIDLVTSLVLFITSHKQLGQINEIEKHKLKFLKDKQEDDISKLSLIRPNHHEISLQILAIYLLSPFCIISCVGQSTSVLTNLLLSLTLCTASYGLRIPSTFFLALISYQSFYPILLIVPVTMMIEQTNQLEELNEKDQSSSSVKYSSESVIFSMLLTVVSFIIILAGLLFGSYYLMDNKWDFLWSTYGFL